MALADALAAHASIDVNVPAALQCYDARRQPASAAVVQRARALGRYLAAQARPTICRAADRRRTPAAVMTQTAWMEGVSRA